MSDFFRWNTRLASRGTTKFQSEEAPFGNGYTQAAPTSRENRRREWDVVISEGIAEALDAKAFLDARRGVDHFDWADPSTGEPVKVRCPEYREQAPSGNRLEIAAKFVEEKRPL